MSLQERIINFIFSQRCSFTEEELVEKFLNLSKYRYSRNEIQEWIHCKIEDFLMKTKMKM